LSIARLTIGRAREERVPPERDRQPLAVEKGYWRSGGSFSDSPKTSTS
jgi:hypothetical protein